MKGGLVCMAQRPTRHMHMNTHEQARDECVVANGEDKCAALIEAHKVR